MAATNNIFINTVPASRVYDKTTSDGKRTFKTVSLSVPGEVSTSGYLSLSVNNGQVYAGKVAGYVNILLGKPDKKVTVSVSNAEAVWVSKTYTVAEIAGFVKEYRSAKAKATATAEG